MWNPNYLIPSLVANDDEHGAMFGDNPMVNESLEHRVKLLLLRCHFDVVRRAGSSQEIHCRQKSLYFSSFKAYLRKVHSKIQLFLFTRRNWIIER